MRVSKYQGIRVSGYQSIRVSGLFVLLISLSFIIAGCGRRAERQKPEQDNAVPVKVAVVETREISEMLEYVGNIRAQDEAVVYPKVSGKIAEKLKEDGSAVHKGDVIAYIDRDEVGLKYEKAPVESPLYGFVGRIYVDIGANVTPQTPIALVVDMDRVKVDLDVPERYLPRITVGQPADVGVDAYPGQKFSGAITKISPVIDLGTRSVPVEITVDNKDHRLNSGMFARVQLALSKHENVPVIIKEAIMGKEPALYTYIVENNRAVLRNIKTGIRQGPYYEVTEGLSGAEMVVIIGQQRLRDGAEVEVEREGLTE
jgi:multidrug efflux pump subunit AcrA (membrane-fusion protein)